LASTKGYAASGPTCSKNAATAILIFTVSTPLLQLLLLLHFKHGR